MILKEAFRYQNYLNTLMQKGLDFITNTENVTVRKQEHFRKKVNVDAEDEVLTVPRRTDLKVTADEVIDFIVSILSEKRKLSNAIDRAKMSQAMNIDSSVALNKQKQGVIDVLNMLTDIQGTERIIRGSAYKFNGEGNQVSYNYDVKEVITIDFDRLGIKKLSKKLSKETDVVSTNIDRIMISCDVTYDALYDLNDSFEDALSTFKESL